MRHLLPLLQRLTQFVQHAVVVTVTVATANGADVAVRQGARHVADGGGLDPRAVGDARHAVHGTRQAAAGGEAKLIQVG